ncbi:MAG: T9SS type A sorting domain-containing protein [Bacteroidetes bacterium]|nr:T9SS type A sorting domain-containing protein [Bacteroidota bacterium]
MHNLLTGTIELQSTSELSVFPNPATSVINVIIDQPVEIIICDLLGKELISKQITSKGKVQVEFDISFLASGVYLIKVENWVSKFVKHD